MPKRNIEAKVGDTWKLVSQAKDTLTIVMNYKSDGLEKIPSLISKKTCGIILKFKVGQEDFAFQFVNFKNIESLSKVGDPIYQTEVLDTLINNSKRVVYKADGFLWSNEIGFIEFYWKGIVYHLK